LVGAAITRYTNLEASQICSWKDLMAAFIRQYQYNTDMAPDRTQLQNMSKREHEYFKEYAQRWRDQAALVAPPMMEREMITMIMDTLPVFLSYPNFVRGLLFDDIQPLIGHFEILGTLFCTICEVPRRAENQKEAGLRDP